ncbi:MAG: queuosine precursor transporter [Planctomycetota bacterium]
MNQTTTIPPAVLHQRRERVFLILAGLFLGTLAMLNILGISRFLAIASYTPGVDGAEGTWAWGQFGEISFALAVGVLPYPLTFLCTDLVSEFYGRKRANFMVFVGLIINVWVIAILWLGGILPGTDSEAFFTIRSLAFGAVAASMIAYLAAQFIDVQVFHFWKKLTNGKHLWLRNNGSTIVSQFVDTFAVITITYFFTKADLPVDGELPIWPQLWLLIATGFVFKLAAALVDTPIIYLAVAVLRKYLHLDPTAEHNADAEDIQMFSRPEQG